MDLLEQNLKQFIKTRPDIVYITNRGLETVDRKVVFIAKNLLKRYPNLKDELLLNNNFEEKDKTIKQYNPSKKIKKKSA